MNFEEIFWAVFDMFVNGVPMERHEMVYAAFACIGVMCLLSIAIGVILVVMGGYKKPDPVDDGTHWSEW